MPFKSKAMKYRQRSVILNYENDKKRGEDNDYSY